MISLQDIFDSISDYLRVMFPGIKKIHMERIRNLQTPALTVELISYNTPKFSANIIEKKVDIEIIFFSKDDSVKEAMVVAEKLSQAFSIGLKVKDRFLHVFEEPETKLIDQDMHFVIRFDFWEEYKPLVPTSGGNEAEFDQGDTNIENIIDERETENVDGVISSKLEYMEEMFVHLEIE
ncbi:MAG: hypothetical protein GXZ11_05650 [Tissierellia bacterium]|nr:hypothetical protein [Tissierellia bacterium]